MIKIAFVSDTLDIGGAEKALLTLLNMLDYSKYDVTIFLPREDGIMQRRIDQHVKVKSWSTNAERKYSVFLKSLFIKRKYLLIGTSLFYRVLAHLYKNEQSKNIHYSFQSYLIDRFDEQNDYDVVIVNQGLNRWHALFARKNISAKKYICWIHSTDYALDDEDRIILSEIYRWYDGFVCVSNAIRDYYREYLLKYTEIYVIYNLVNTSEICKAADDIIEEQMNGFVFTTVGRLSREKGQLMIPYVAHELLKLGYNFTWFIVGDGQDKDKIEHLISDLSLDNQVVLTGMKDNPYPYIKQCDLYIQPSYTEGFCLATIEAKMLKRHIVLTDIPVMRELFTKDEVFFSEPSVSSLVKTIQKALMEVHHPVSYNFEDENYNNRQICKFDNMITAQLRC